MWNPFNRSRRYGAPSRRPTTLPSAERPMPAPEPIYQIIEDSPVSKPAAPPSAETPMKPPAQPAQK